MLMLQELEQKSWTWWYRPAITSLKKLGLENQGSKAHEIYLVSSKQAWDTEQDPVYQKQKIWHELIFGSLPYTIVWLLWGPQMVTSWNSQIYMLVEIRAPMFHYLYVTGIYILAEIRYTYESGILVTPWVCLINLPIKTQANRLSSLSPWSAPSCYEAARRYPLDTLQILNQPLEPGTKSQTFWIKYLAPTCVFVVV